jgi:hypothetical protein
MLVDDAHDKQVCTTLTKRNVLTRKVGRNIKTRGTIEEAVRSNDNPFRIATDEDVSTIFSFLGQVKGRLLYRVRDLNERAVPSIMEWTLKRCDLNKDILTTACTCHKEKEGKN